MNFVEVVVTEILHVIMVQIIDLFLERLSRHLAIPALGGLKSRTLPGSS